MRKSYITAIFFIGIILSLIYNILVNNKRVDGFFKFHRDIADIVVINDNLNKFIDSPINFKNFDFIKDNIFLSKEKLFSIEEEVLLISSQETIFKEDFYLLKNSLERKIDFIEKLKSYRAVLNNSFRNIIKLFPNIQNKEYINLYTKIITLNVNPDFKYENINKLIDTLPSSSKYEELFLLHSKIISRELSNFNKLKEDIENLRLDTYITKFEYKYSSFIKSIIGEVKDTILILILILAVILGLFLVYAYGILKDQIELKRFKNAVENSDNFVIVTDADKKIKYINSSMLRSMGYKIDEVIGKNPSIFRAGFIEKSTYKKMNEAIFSGKKWTGEFINKTKDGKLIYEKASITPILDENGKIEEFLGIKLDITKEKEILNSLKEKDHRLTQQAKLVVMNEILNSIAHQWRQPLSVISTATSGLLIQKEFNTLSDEVFEDLTSSIMENTQYLSSTIDNFKAFFKTGNDVTLFNLKNSFEKAYNLIAYRIINDNIVYETSGDEIKIKGIENDLIQVFVNLFSNSIEALENLYNQKRYLMVSFEKDKEFIVIKIKDNAMGIKEENLTKIFQPYFTTKYNSQGTGMGLYMCHEIITKQFNGKIMVKNDEYLKNDEMFKGVEVTIVLPLQKDIGNE